MFILGDIAGITINFLSITGMLLVVGILVDDGIVIAENIYTHFQNGKEPKEAAVEGTLEMIPSVFTSVSTTIVAFLPLIFLDNNGMTERNGLGGDVLPWNFVSGGFFHSSGPLSQS